MRLVKCCALEIESELHNQYPEHATPEQIAQVDASCNQWYEDYKKGQVFFLSPAALDRGFRFWSTLDVVERLEYRFIRELGADLLCRHARYFVNPADPNDLRMTDDAPPVVVPASRVADLTSPEKAEKVRVDPPQVRLG